MTGRVARTTTVFVLAAIGTASLGGAILVAVQAPTPRALLERAVGEFAQGNVDASVATFDRLVAAAPEVERELWQRGIALYYAKRFAECRRQFELYRTVGPNDVENAAWHFLCVARAESPERARLALLPVGPDTRVPMRQVYELFKGTMTPAQVLSAAGAQPSGQFYARLYLGLYFEATGAAARAREEMTAAADPQYRAAGGYMHMVARVHLDRMTRGLQ